MELDLMTMLSVSLIAHGIRDLPEPVSIINLQGKILPYLYVFHAEMYAVLQCARSDDLRHRCNDSIAICTDSQAALKALASPKVTSALVAETVASLRELAIRNSVRLVWVPAIMVYQEMRQPMYLLSKHQHNPT